MTLLPYIKRKPLHTKLICYNFFPTTCFKTKFLLLDNSYSIVEYLTPVRCKNV